MADVLKIIVDGAFHEAAMCGSWGFMMRENNGDVMGLGAARMEQYVASAMQAEMTACLEALQAASACMGMTSVQLKSDGQSAWVCCC